MNSREIELYMQHCFFLAKKGIGFVSPNPPVGALLVHQNKIIGEGYHKAYGEAHAEIAAIESVAPKQKHLIAESSLFVSLEPCNHFGKTPPCCQRILQEGIKNVYYSIQDPNPQMSGKSISWLRQNGIVVNGPILAAQGLDLIRSFYINTTQCRPYVILKFAQSSDFYIANEGRTKISNEYSNRLVHKWRHESDGILIGKNTLISDNPLLTTRLWPGKNPTRILLGNIPDDQKSSYVFFNDEAKSFELDDLIRSKDRPLQQILNSILQKGIGVLLVEGGAHTIQSFIDTGLWDEARIITNQKLKLISGIKAPCIKGFLENKFILESDVIHIIRKNRPS
ncbi:MAG: bifunctional diaminohydroxyphosphoribosylaminopyrimidine deaminase/5-amino-6-(5-phosphoribosylamino)uracil reductase RibD [Saprospiraceae bacterium]|nr:bifunctional diaminohydroxyphosphoribosylaminopyrimidine deaminase/5-amino-6-(5-phosphoribosylamino)uracil reductase RibD [Saprospiraceae bacterium]